MFASYDLFFSWIHLENNSIIHYTHTHTHTQREKKEIEKKNKKTLSYSWRKFPYHVHPAFRIFILNNLMVILNLGLVGSSTVLAVGSPRQSDQKKKKKM